MLVFKNNYFRNFFNWERKGTSTYRVDKNTTDLTTLSVYTMNILRSRRSLVIVAGMKKTNDHAEPTKVER